MKTIQLPFKVNNTTQIVPILNSDYLDIIMAKRASDNMEMCFIYNIEDNTTSERYFGTTISDSGANLPDEIKNEYHTSLITNSVEPTFISFPGYNTSVPSGVSILPSNLLSEDNNWLIPIQDQQGSFIMKADNNPVPLYYNGLDIYASNIEFTPYETSYDYWHDPGCGKKYIDYETDDEYSCYFLGGFTPKVQGSVELFKFSRKYQASGQRLKTLGLIPYLDLDSYDITDDKTYLNNNFVLFIFNKKIYLYKKDSSKIFYTLDLTLENPNWVEHKNGIFMNYIDTDNNIIQRNDKLYCFKENNLFIFNEYELFPELYDTTSGRINYIKDTIYDIRRSLINKGFELPNKLGGWAKKIRTTEVIPTPSGITATAADVLEGKTAYTAAGEVETGTLILPIDTGHAYIRGSIDIVPTPETPGGDISIPVFDEKGKLIKPKMLFLFNNMKYQEGIDNRDLLTLILYDKPFSTVYQFLWMYSDIDNFIRYHGRTTSSTIINYSESLNGEHNNYNILKSIDDEDFSFTLDGYKIDKYMENLFKDNSTLHYVIIA